MDTERAFNLKAFKEAELVPDYVPEGFNTFDFIHIEYPGNVKVECGKLISRADGKPTPKVTFKVEDESAKYALLSIDPDAPTKSWAILGPIRHWAVINIPGSSGDVSTGQEIGGNYIGPGPPPFTGEHRYVFLLYKQTKSDAKFELAGKMRWDYKTFIKDNGLELVAADFYVSKH